ncbi:MAG: RNA polymerase [Bacilli bacterium]|mgnify:CR=1 FL=1|nr:RNA polymerase [Bacilli bacterium]
MTREELYEEHGAKDRDEYLENLAEENGVDPWVVNELAGMLGEDEDFDGLVSFVEDFGGMF